MGNRVIKSGQIEIAHPSHSIVVVFPYAPLESTVCVLPAAKEEYTGRLLKDVTENDLELKWNTVALHTLCSEICECLQNNLILNM